MRNRHTASLNVWAIAALLLVRCLSVPAQPPETATQADRREQLTDLSIEALMNVEVTSVSKHPEKQHEAAAAIFVLTNDDLRRSGATSIPDALRLAPGIYVAHLEANCWSVTARGLGGRYANKLLVLIDGREIYAPTFSGVEWEAQDVMLEDVDRIEVIRGPGASLWGANAVNGVINIVTKHASETQGGLISAGAGTETELLSAARYGIELNDTAWMRVYSKYSRHGSGHLSDGGDGNDSWDMVQTGFRLDADFDADDSLTLQGDGCGGAYEQISNRFTYPPPYERQVVQPSEYYNGNVNLRWDHTLDDSSSIHVQTYYKRDVSESSDLNDHQETYDFSFQHHITSENGHEWIWGAGFRYLDDSMDNTWIIAISPAERERYVVNAFVQDNITLLEDRLKLTLGTKLERNAFTGVELQPTARMAWTPNENTTLWTAVSRAARTPSRVEDDASIAAMRLPFSIAYLNGQRDFQSEELWAFEAGVRHCFNEHLTLDLAAYFNDYASLRSLDLAGLEPRLSPFPHIAVLFDTANRMDAQTWGTELALEWNQSRFSRSRIAYSLYTIALDLHPWLVDPISGEAAGDTPKNQLQFTQSFNFLRTCEADFIFRYVDSLPTLGIDSYSELDVRLAWKPSEAIECALTGQNLLQGGHREYKSSYVNSETTDTERGVYGKVTWKF